MHPTMSVANMWHNIIISALRHCTLATLLCAAIITSAYADSGEKLITQEAVVMTPEKTRRVLQRYGRQFASQGEALTRIGSDLAAHP